MKINKRSSSDNVVLGILFQLMVVAILLSSCGQEKTSPYTGQETREIKALSESEINQLLSGAGMGLAKAAELNRYPGPKHVLELAENLSLSANQEEQTRQSFDKMHEQAVNLGQQIIEAEEQLELLFASKSAGTDTVKELVASIAMLQGQLRFSHLQAHLEMVHILNEGQIQQYVKLRGYNSARHQH